MLDQMGNFDIAKLCLKIAQVFFTIAKLHWGVAAFYFGEKGDGQHNCSNGHGHHSKEPKDLFNHNFFLLARPLICYSALAS
ncbi:hypothetical protein I6M75_16140 [Acinetobacter bereziniae]|nr:hypothetical protein [Acinetobacter bereziniae]MBJ8476569.1 hypothetical protein [Acinetobacter bereziniae]